MTAPSSAMLPTTQTARPYPTGRHLVSKTDLRGFITYANDAFVELSGYSRAELLGANHNIVRHPDMPPQAFEDLWRTAKEGLPWTGIVKNRAKNGDYYWVKAFIVPVREDDRIVGYMSVRSEPTPAEVNAAAAAYRRANETGAALDSRPPRLKDLSIRTRLMGIMACIALLLAVGAVIGIGGAASSKNALDSTYRNKLEPVDLLWRTTTLMNDSRAQVMLGLQHNSASAASRQHDHPLTVHTEAILKNRDAMSSLWSEFMARDISPEERAQADKYAAARERYMTEGVAPANQALLDEHFDVANDILLRRMNPLYRAAASEAETLLDLLKSSARHDYDKAVDRYELIRNLAVWGTAAALVIILVAAMLLLRSIVSPLQRVIAHFNRISQGDLSAEIDLTSRNEVGRVMSSLAAMQVHLKVMLDEISSAATAIEKQSHLMKEETATVALKSGQQRDRTQSVVSATEESSQAVREVSASAERTAQAAKTSQAQVVASQQGMSESIGATERVVTAVQSSSHAIGTLNRAVAKIADISQVIKEIADQTNLLALNAAIEAARAGAHGRGFAIVADEVRKLAERTGSSTADITVTVSEIRQVTDAAVSAMDRAVTEVDHGTAMIRKGGEDLERVSAAGREVADMAQHIAGIAQEQALASAQVAGNMEEIAELIDDNAAAAEQARAVADELLETAAALRKVVTRFRLTG